MPGLYVFLILLASKRSTTKQCGSPGLPRERIAEQSNDYFPAAGPGPLKCELTSLL